MKDWENRGVEGMGGDGRGTGGGSSKRVKSGIDRRKSGGGVLPYERLVGMCRWMGSHFHD